MQTSRSLWALTLGFLALHLVLAVSLPLVEDEAYYQLWATVPSAGYYDHPPMVAWGIAAGQALFGETLLGVRAVSILTSAIVTLLIFRTTWLFCRDNSIAFRAALWGKVMVPFAILGFAATPDATSILFWTASIWALAEVIKGGRAHWWLLVGLFAGLGVLSKFTNLFFGLALVIWLVGSREGRAWLGHWQVWAGALIGLAVLVPFGLWNEANGWIGLERQFGRIGDANPDRLQHFGLYLLSIAFLVTPLVLWLALRSVWSRHVPSVLIWLTAPIVIYLTYHATQSEAGGQWLGPIFPTLAIMAALAAGSGRITRWAAPSGLAIGVLAAVIGFWPGKVLIGGHNPLNQVRGWDDVTVEIRSLAAKNGAVWIATDAYGLTGQLHHYLGAELPVWSVTRPEKYLFRGSFPAELCAAKGLFISRTEFPGGAPYFSSTTPGPTIERREGARVLMRYHTAVVAVPNDQAQVDCGPD